MSDSSQGNSAEYQPSQAELSNAFLNISEQVKRAREEYYRGLAAAEVDPYTMLNKDQKVALEKIKIRKQVIADQCDDNIAILSRSLDRIANFVKKLDGYLGVLNNRISERELSKHASTVADRFPVDYIVEQGLKTANKIEDVCNGSGQDLDPRKLYSDLQITIAALQEAKRKRCMEIDTDFRPQLDAMMEEVEITKRLELTEASKKSSEFIGSMAQTLAKLGFAERNREVAPKVTYGSSLRINMDEWGPNLVFLKGDAIAPLTSSKRDPSFSNNRDFIFEKSMEGTGLFGDVLFMTDSGHRYFDFRVSMDAKDGSPWLLLETPKPDMPSNDVLQYVLAGFLSAVPFGHLEIALALDASRVAYNPNSLVGRIVRDYSQLLVYGAQGVPSAEQAVEEAFDLMELRRSIFSQDGNTVFDQSLDQLGENFKVRLLCLETPSFATWSDDARQKLIALANEGWKYGIFMFVISPKNAASLEIANSTHAFVVLSTETSNLPEGMKLPPSCFGMVSLLSADNRPIPFLLEQQSVDIDSLYSLPYGIATGKTVFFPKRVKEQLESPAVSESSAAEAIPFDSMNETSVFPDRMAVGLAGYSRYYFVTQTIFKNASTLYRSSGMGEKKCWWLPFDMTIAPAFRIVAKKPEGSDAFSGSGMFDKASVDFLKNTTWRFLMAMPVKKARLVLFDIGTRGEKASAFLGLVNEIADPELMEVVTDNMQAVQKLNQIDEWATKTRLEKLAGKYLTLDQYNEASPKRTEPFTLMVFFDDLYSLGDTMQEKLADMIAKNDDCAVSYLFRAADPSAEKIDSTRFTSWEKPDFAKKIIGQCTVFEGRNDMFKMPNGLMLRSTPPNFKGSAQDFVSAYVAACNALQDSGSFDDVVPESLFGRSASEDLYLPIGFGDAGKEVALDFSGDGFGHHALVAGATGSGKSTLLHGIIMSALSNYSPDEVNLYLLDFKSGTEFQAYDRKLPQVKLIALDAMQEFGQSILQELVDIMVRRGKAFKEEGVNNLSEYRARTGRAMPRILVVMDEVQVLFNMQGNQKVASECGALAGKIASEGRSFGIHLIMATQSIADLYSWSLDRRAIEQMAIRIGINCSEREAGNIFSTDTLTDALAKMKGPRGTAVMNPNIANADNIGFIFPRCSAVDRDPILDRLESELAGWETNVRIFDGSRTESLLGHVQKPEGGSDVRIDLGSPVRVGEEFSLVYGSRRQHMLVHGMDADRVNGIIDAFAIAALASGNADVLLIDGNHVAYGSSDSELRLVHQLQRLFPDSFAFPDYEEDVEKELARFYDKAFHGSDEGRKTFVLAKDFEYVDTLVRLLNGEFVENPFASGDVEESAEDAEEVLEIPNNPFASIESLMQKRRSRPTEPSTGAASESVTDMFNKILDKGPRNGVFVILGSSDTNAIQDNLTRSVTQQGKRILNLFADRILFSSTDKAFDLASNVDLTVLPEQLAFFTDGKKLAFQFIPYEVPDSEELEASLSK